MNQNKTDELRERIDALHQAMLSGRTDFASDSDAQEVKEMIEAIFAEQSNTLSAYNKHLGAALSDDEYRALQRRKDALFRLLPEAYRRFGKRYPDLNPAEELILLNAPAVTQPDEETLRAYDTELAAAIWILDALRDNGADEEAAQYLPRTRELLDSVYLPNLSDAVHSDDALRAVIRLIRDRRDEENGGKANYDAVIALIDSESIATIREQFVAYVWDFADCLFGFVNERRTQYAEQKKQLNALLQQTEAAPLLNPMKSDTNPANVTISLDTETFTKVKELDQSVVRNKSDLERLYAFIRTVSVPTEADALYRGMRVPDVRCPYDMCFAYLSLTDSDDDCVRLDNLSYNIMAFACRALPWADSGAVDPDNTREELDVDYEYLAGQIEKMPDWDDNRTNEIMYKKLLHSPLCTPSHSRISISQLAFLSSGLIPPRRANSISYTKAILHDTDLSQEQKELLYEYFSLAYAVNHRDDEYDEDDNSGDSAAEEDAERIKQLRGELKHLRSVIHRLEQRSKDAEQRLAEANRKLDAANNELAELRTMIRESCDTEDAEAVTVTFPYTAQKRSVIIGGHDSWVKAIRPLLDNVRFIASSEQPNSGVILNSEVVWLQTNALGHSGYYKIIDIVRRNHIKVCYFRYASAEKCAEQFALEDMAQDEPDTE